MNQLQAVLFDLDGTLLDTAPDMVESLLQLLTEESAPPIDYALARSHVSNGALGLIDIGFAEQLSDESAFQAPRPLSGNLCGTSRRRNDSFSRDGRGSGMPRSTKSCLGHRDQQARTPDRAAAGGARSVTALCMRDQR